MNYFDIGRRDPDSTRPDQHVNWNSAGGGGVLLVTTIAGGGSRRSACRVDSGKPLHHVQASKFSRVGVAPYRSAGGG